MIGPPQRQWVEPIASRDTGVAILKTALSKIRDPDPNKQRFFDALLGMLRTWNGEAGNPLDQVVTLRDFAEDTKAKSILSKVTPGTGIAGVISTDNNLDRSPPTALTNLTASGAMATILLEWEGVNQANYSYTEVWRATSDDLGQAVMIGHTRGSLFADAVGATSELYYYWVRAISPADVPGPFNATAGTSATTDPVSAGNFASSIEPIGLVSTLPNPVGYTGPSAVFLATDNKLYRHTGSEWTSEVDAQDLAVGSVIAGKIAAGAISTTDLFVNGVITGIKIQAGTITADRMSVTELSAISANLGTITAGSLNIGPNKFIVDSSGNTTIQNATTGARLVVKNNVIQVYDSAGVKRVQIGDLSIA